MISLNKISLICTLASTITIAYPPQQQLNKQNLPNYVRHYVATLYGSRQADNREVVELARNIAHTIENDNNLCHWDWLNWRCEYNVNEVQEAIHAHVVDYIENQVHHIAWDYTRDGQTIQQLIAHFSNEATRILTQSSHLNGQFVEFLHDKLKQKVWRMKERLDKERKAQRPQLYPSDDCCVCMEDFDDVQRVFLSPCGHDICAGCAHQWFFGQSKSSCPHCRSKVNIAQLRETLRI